MASVRVVVGSPVGLHARPSAVFVQAVVASGLPVTISRISDGAQRPSSGSSSASSSAPVDARSILGVLALDIACGEEVELVADGPDADAVLHSLAVLLAAE